MILLASVSSGILTMWLNRERRRAWTIADRLGPEKPSGTSGAVVFTGQTTFK